MKIMLAQRNPRVGDLEGNYEDAKGVMAAAKASGVELVVFPELAVTGYPPKDLLQKPAFVKAAYDYTVKWSELSHDAPAMIFGGVCGRHGTKTGKPLFNDANFAARGFLAGRQAKTLLPTYDVFDEARYFEPAPSREPFLLSRNILAVSICEDIWNDKEFWKETLYPVDPVKEMMLSWPDSKALINISASPFALDKPEVRERMLSHIARKYQRPLIYVNQVGGNDDVVYDGRSLVFDADGNLIVRMPAFESAMATIDIDASNAEIREELPNESWEIFKALVLGTRDYAAKTGFKKAVLGLSGGIDSAVVACIAAHAFGPENVLGVAMPSKFSSQHSVDDAKSIAEKLKMEFKIIPITEPHAAYNGVLKDVLPGDGDSVRPWEENLQARIRGAYLMSISNEQNRLLLTTGNKSEVAMGYCTLYGDTCGGLAVISDVFKMKVYDLARWYNRTYGIVIPSNSIDKPPSAELRPNQKDQDSLPPYPVLDFILSCYIEQEMEADEIMEQVPSQPWMDSHKADRALVADIIRKVDRMEYKRKQLAPGLKITRKAFGCGRQMPIAEGWKG